MIEHVSMYPLSDVAVLPVSSLLADEWPMLCSERIVWSSRRPAKLIEESQGGFGREVPTSWLWEEMYRRIYVRHIDVIPVLFRNAQLDIERLEPLVDLIDGGGVHHMAFGEWAMASVIVACRSQGQPEWDEPVQIQPYYAVGNTLRQHVSFRVVNSDVQPSLEKAFGKPKQPH